MVISGNKTPISPRLLLSKQVEDLSGEKISACYQCEKCSNGCPVTFAMDIAPNKVMHLIHLGQIDRVLASNTMWVCASCETCTTRCPNGIDVAHVMDTLRKMSVKTKKVNQPQVPLFHNTFLSSIKRHGKIHEFEMITLYTLKNQGLGGLISQAKGLGLKMLRRGKLKILPYSLTGNGEVKQFFKQEQKQR